MPIHAKKLKELHALSGPLSGIDWESISQMGATGLSHSDLKSFTTDVSTVFQTMQAIEDEDVKRREEVLSSLDPVGMFREVLELASRHQGFNDKVKKVIDSQQFEDHLKSIQSLLDASGGSLTDFQKTLESASLLDESKLADLANAVVGYISPDILDAIASHPNTYDELDKAVNIRVTITATETFTPAAGTGDVVITLTSEQWCFLVLTLIVISLTIVAYVAEGGRSVSSLTLWIDLLKDVLGVGVAPAYVLKDRESGEVT